MCSGTGNLMSNREELLKHPIPVDLSAGGQGIVVFERRPTYYCQSVTPNNDGTYRVRIESGWHEDYNKNGTHTNPQYGRIIGFLPCHGSWMFALDLKSETTP